MRSAESIAKQYQKRKESRTAKLEAQAGRPKSAHCEICLQPGNTVYDHCHTKGHFRGWICSRCNKVLGNVYDDTSILQRMIQYLHERN